MLDVVCWLWRPLVEHRSIFTPENVNILQRMVARHYPHPHRFSCITDHTEGFSPDVRVIPLWKDYYDRESIYGPGTPSCYRRLKAFDAEMRDIIGPRFVSIDLDVCITGDLSPVWNRPEPFVIWGERARRTPYNGSMWMMDAGARAFVWERFNADPERAISRARAAGFFGSDQAWMCYVLGAGEPRWTSDDGVYSYRLHVRPNAGKLPRDARVVFFEGSYDPWRAECQRDAPWIRDYYR